MPYALVDCNNFYASCERIFNPALINKPIVILSNNDGCVIARSNEAKALDIPMGVPYFKCKDLCKKHNVHVFSSNFTLYGDMSARVMRVIQDHCREMEIYSIDEAFIKLSPAEADEDFAENLKIIIEQYTGVKVSIGVAPTKVLAKVANALAKKYGGIMSLMDPAIRAIFLDTFPIEDIWGIGRRLAPRLNHLGIKTITELIQYNQKIFRQHFGIIGEKIQAELQGIGCLELEKDMPKKSIEVSRSFRYGVTKLSELEEAVSCYAVRAALKLKQENRVIQQGYMYVKIKPAKGYSRFTYRNAQFTLDDVTGDPSILIKAVKQAAAEIFRKDERYHKAGIVLFNLQAPNPRQSDFFRAPELENLQQVNNKLDVLVKINKKFGEDSLYFAAQGIERNWKARSDRRSPRYSTCWNELAQVKA